MLSPSCAILVPSGSVVGAKGLLFDTFGSHVGHEAPQEDTCINQSSDFEDSCMVFTHLKVSNGSQFKQEET